MRVSKLNDVREQMEFRVGFAERITALRHHKKLTQDQFATRIGLGREQVTNMENARAMTKITVIVTIAKEFGVSCDWLLGLKKRMK